MTSETIVYYRKLVSATVSLNDPTHTEVRELLKKIVSALKDHEWLKAERVELEVLIDELTNVCNTPMTLGFYGGTAKRM
jgi:hypothetical protein